MRIAILSPIYPFRGGIAQFSASVYRALEVEHELQAFTFTRQYPDLLFPGKTQYVGPDDKADEISSLRVLDSINPLSYYKTAKAINQYEPDVLIIMYWMSFFGPSMGTVAKKINPRTKVISVLHNVIPHETNILDRPLTKYFLKHNQGFVALSKSVQNDLTTLSQSDKPLLLTEHPYYDHFGAPIDMLEARQTLNLATDKKTILFFGFIREYKGLDILIETFSTLDDSYQLLIAGECYGSFAPYQALIDASPLKANIHVHSEYIGDDKVPLYFSAADVCVLPYRSATQSGITSISMHFDLPVIATDVGGLKESILHNENGLIVTNAAPSAIAKSIKRYFDEGLRSSFLKKISALKEANSWSAFAKKLVSFTEQI